MTAGTKKLGNGIRTSTKLVSSLLCLVDFEYFHVTLFNRTPLSIRRKVLHLLLIFLFQLRPLPMSFNKLIILKLNLPQPRQ